MLREIHPGYILPVGVWNVRESIRSLLTREYRTFETLAEALEFSCTNFLIQKPYWIVSSELLKRGFQQRKITDFN